MGVRAVIAAIARTALAGYAAIALALLTVAVVVPRIPVVGDALLDADEAAVDAITDHRSDGLVTSAFTVMGNLADTLTIIGVVAGAGVALALARRWRELAVLAVAVPLEMAVFVTVATLSGRARPASALEPVAVGGSFPSGHAGIAVAVFGGMSVVTHLMTTDRVAQRTSVVMAVLLALVVGAGRIYQTMHHPSDVVAGWAAGSACLAVAVVASRHVPERDDHRSAESDEDAVSRRAS